MDRGADEATKSKPSDKQREQCMKNNEIKKMCFPTTPETKEKVLTTDFFLMVKRDVDEYAGKRGVGKEVRKRGKETVTFFASVRCC